MSLLRIESCKECKDCDIGRDCTTDSFEYCEYYACKLMKGKGD